MNRRLVKFYVAVALFCCATYLLWMGIAEWVGELSTKAALLRTDKALLLSILGMGFAVRLGWKTILEEFAVTSD